MTQFGRALHAPRRGKPPAKPRCRSGPCAHAWLAAQQPLVGPRAQQVPPRGRSAAKTYAQLRAELERHNQAAMPGEGQRVRAILSKPCFSRIRIIVMSTRRPICDVRAECGRRKWLPAGDDDGLCGYPARVVGCESAQLQI
jgi:hypothetical protein